MSPEDPGKESRKSEGIPVVPAIDGFRALAVLGIALYHVILFAGAAPGIAAGPFEAFPIVLALGLDVLFIVSGFVLFLPTVVRGGDFGPVGPYAIRRLARVGPAYWFALLLVFVLLVVAPPYEFGRTEGELGLPTAGELAGHAVFLHTPLQMADPGFALGLGLNGPLWTLSLEVVFYALLPVVAAVYFRHPWLGLAAAAAVTTGWHLVFGHFEDLTSWLGLGLSPERQFSLIVTSDYQFPAFVFTFAAGMTAARLFMRWRPAAEDPSIRRRITQIQLAALAGAVLSAYLAFRYGIASVGEGEFANTAAIGRRAPLASFAFTMCAATLIVATALAPPGRQALVANPLARWLADVSYGTYLIHFVVLAYLLRWVSLPQTGSVAVFCLWAALTIALSLAYGYASARLLERPIRRWAHKFGSRAVQRATRAAQSP